MSAAQKVALVTGASGGIGRAAALRFAAAGYRTVVSDVKEEGGHKTVEMITSNSGEATFIKADVSKESDVSSMIQRIKEQYGRLDAAYNNAGVDGEMANTVECTLANWERTIGINLTGVFLCCKYEIPLMLENGGGAIVNCSSVLGKEGFATLPAYAASKHGVIGFTKSLALDMAQQGVRVNAVCPGIIGTEMVEHAASEGVDMNDMVKNKQPIGRMGRPEEVAEAVLWLCSEKASFVTGTALDVDGGWSAQ